MLEAVIEQYVVSPPSVCVCVCVCVIDDTTNGASKHWQPSYLLSDRGGEGLCQQLLLLLIYLSPSLPPVFLLPFFLSQIKALSVMYDR